MPPVVTFSGAPGAPGESRVKPPEVPPYVQQLRPYVPGKPIEEVEREYGVTGIIKLASNENPLGPSPRAAGPCQGAPPRPARYPGGRGRQPARGPAPGPGAAPGAPLVGTRRGR